MDVLPVVKRIFVVRKRRSPFVAQTGNARLVLVLQFLMGFPIDGVF